MSIVFGRAWEDDRLDARILAVAPGDHVLVVAGAGDAALALIAAGAVVTAVDRNPDQLRLVALKAAAARGLPAARLYRWFETGPIDARSEGRRTAAQALAAEYRGVVRPWLAAEDAAFWDAHLDLVARGLPRLGVGRPFARLGRLIRLIVPGLERTIETAVDPAQQLVFWRRRVRPRVFCSLAHLAAAKTPLLAPLAPNPRELRRMRTERWSYGLESRVDAIVASTLVREHPWWRPALSGRPAGPDAGAAWLDGCGLPALREGLDGASEESASCDGSRTLGRLRLVRGDLTAVLAAAPPVCFTAISVSNVPDWLPPADEAALAAAVRRALVPGGRVLVRRVCAATPTGDAFARAGFRRDPQAVGLVAQERTALYETVELLRSPL